MRTLRAICVLTLAILACGTPAAPQEAGAPPPISANGALPVPPPSAPLADWVDADGRSNRSIETRGATLRGWLYGAADPNSKNVVLFFYGNGGRIDGARFLPTVASLGPRVLAFDYRGFGFSSGTADMLAIRRDALLEFDQAATIAGDPAHVIVLGFSLGTAVASYVASVRKIGGLALIAPIASAKEEFAYFPVAQHRMSMAEASTLRETDDAREVFDETALVRRSAAPLLVVHGDADDVVSYAQGEEVFAAATGAPKTFVTLHGVNHVDAPERPETLDALRAFFASV